MGRLDKRDGVDLGPLPVAWTSCCRELSMCFYENVIDEILLRSDGIRPRMAYLGVPDGSQVRGWCLASTPRELGVGEESVMHVALLLYLMSRLPRVR